MWKQPWRYDAGWVICIGLTITGTILHLFFGFIEPESFRFPVNLIIGGLFFFFFLILHVRSGKVKALQWFAGHTAGITSLTSLLVLVVVMGFTGLVQMTASWPFILLSFYLLSVLGLVVLERTNCLKWRDTGFILNHAGLFIAFLGAILGSSDLQRLRVSAPLNEPERWATNHKNQKVELPFTIELHAFTIDEYPPKLLILDNHTGKALPVKKPQSVSIESTPFSTQLLAWDVEVTQYIPSSSALYVVARNVVDSTQKEGWVSCGNYMFPFRSLPLNQEVSLIMPNREHKRYASDIKLYAKSGKTKEGVVEVNRPLSFTGWKIYQLSYETGRGKWSRYSVFELVRDPWLPVVYIGIGMLLAGSLLMLVSIRKKGD
jgi:hypothetical protein